MTKAEFSSFTDYYEYSPEEMKKRSAEFYAEMKRRRTVRQFSDWPVPREIYVTESVGIATGMLITAVHHAGLVCLTYTPSKMGFLNQTLSRSLNERPFLILVVGYPAKDTVLPKIAKKSLKDVAKFI